MNFLESEEVRKYIKILIVSGFIFICVAIGLYWYFLPNYEITLKETTVEYGEDAKVVRLIEKIGKTEIDADFIVNSNTLILDDYEVTFDDIDTSKLGPQTIAVHFSNDKIADAEIEITVVDTKAPEIEFLVEENTKVALKTVKDEKWNQFVSVTDNHSTGDDLEVEYDLDTKVVDYSDKIKLSVVAKDSSGNTSEKEIALVIEDEPKKEEQKKETKSTISQDNTSSSNVTQPNTSAGSNYETYVQPSIPKPGNRSYMFSDGYDMSSAPSACQADLLSSGYTGSCTPIQDADGIYIGMQLTFN